ncbi:hypothetical protein N9E03_01065 [bacterium]|jgi:hypothetical protein|nr:hypothetical protein [bacterium]
MNLEYSEIVNKIEVSQELIEVFKSRIKPSATGYLYTTISTLEQYITELEKQLVTMEQTC